MKKTIRRVNEDVAMAYFSELSENLKASILWTATFNAPNNVSSQRKCKITKVSTKQIKLRAFLKKKNIGYQPKKLKTLSREELQTFLLNAPDDTFLLIKVIRISCFLIICTK